jgi:hypothetical protein
MQSNPEPSLRVAVSKSTQPVSLPAHTRTTDSLDRLLRRLRLLLAVDDGHVRNVDLEEIVLAGAAAQMRHGLDEGHALDVTDSSTELDDAHIRHFVGIVNGYLRNLDDPVLDGIGDVRHDLHRLAQVVALALALDDVLVDFARGDVIIASQGDVEVALVVAEIEVDLAAVGEDKDLAMPAMLLSVCRAVYQAERRTPLGSWCPHRH